MKKTRAGKKNVNRSQKKHCNRKRNANKLRRNNPNPNHVVNTNPLPPTQIVLVCPCMVQMKTATDLKWDFYANLELLIEMYHDWVPDKTWKGFGSVAKQAGKVFVCAVIHWWLKR